MFFDDGTALAVVDNRTQKWLAALDPVANAQFEALFREASLTKRKNVVKKGVILDGLSVNIFGPQDGVVEKDAGKRLKEVSAFLQHPMELASNIQYYNPQYFVRPGHDRNITHLVGSCRVNTSLVAVGARIANEVNGILESLEGEPCDEHLQFIPPLGLSSELKRSLPHRIVPLETTNRVSADLNRHQTQAMLFILKREPGNPFSLCQRSHTGVIASTKSK